MSFLKRCVFVTESAKAGQIGLTLLRLFAGFTMAFAHGLGKFPIHEQLIKGVEALGFPMPTLFAYAAASTELVGGVLLAIGFLTRPVGVFLAFTMAVAGFVAHAADPFQVKELAFLYLFVAIFFACYGGGKYSVDRVIAKALK